MLVSTYQLGLSTLTRKNRSWIASRAGCPRSIPAQEGKPI